MTSPSRHAYTVENWQQPASEYLFKERVDVTSLGQQQHTQCPWTASLPGCSLLPQTVIDSSDLDFAALAHIACSRASLLVPGQHQIMGLRESPLLPSFLLSPPEPQQLPASMACDWQFAHLQPRGLTPAFHGTKHARCPSDPTQLFHRHVPGAVPAAASWRLPPTAI